MNEQQFFDLKQKFLREIPHPKLIIKGIQQLAGGSALQFEVDSHVLYKDKTLLDALNEYIQQLMPLKLEISRCKDEDELSKLLIQLLEFQWGLIKKLNSYHPGLLPNAAVNEIKQSQAFDVYTYLKELKQEHLDENEIKTYLCGQFEQRSLEDMSELSKGVIRANKIVEHGREV